MTFQEIFILIESGHAVGRLAWGDGAFITKKNRDGIISVADTLAEDWVVRYEENENVPPCPFCGQPVYVADVMMVSSIFYSVICRYCGAHGPTRKDVPAAIYAWGVRKFALECSWVGGTRKENS